MLDARSSLSHASRLPMVLARFAVPAAGATAALPQGHPETYPFGLALPQPGNDAPYGKDQTTWTGYAIEEINKAGGVGGKKLAMVVEDSQSDPKRGIVAFQKLASVDKVPL